MEREKIKKRLEKAILKVRTQLSKKDLGENASLTLDLGFDSMGLVALAGELEREFSHSLPLSEWLDLEKDKRLEIGSLTDFLEKRAGDF